MSARRARPAQSTPGVSASAVHHAPALPATAPGAYDPWATRPGRIDDAADLAGLDPDVHRLLQLPDRVLEVAVPVRMDDGHVEVFPAGGSTTTPPGARPRAASASIPPSRPARSPPWPPT